MPEAIVYCVQVGNLSKRLWNSPLLSIQPFIPLFMQILTQPLTYSFIQTLAQLFIQLVIQTLI